MWTDISEHVVSVSFGDGLMPYYVWRDSVGDVTLTVDNAEGTFTPTLPRRPYYRDERRMP